MIYSCYGLVKALSSGLREETHMRGCVSSDIVRASEIRNPL
jgi:hypothetical protein